MSHSNNPIVQQTMDTMKKSAQYLKKENIDYQTFLIELIVSMNSNDRNTLIQTAKDGIKQFAKHLKNEKVNFEGLMFKAMEEIDAENKNNDDDDEKNDYNQQQRITLLTRDWITKKCKSGHSINERFVYFGSSQCIQCGKGRKMQQNTQEKKTFLEQQQKSSNSSEPNKEQTKTLKKWIAAICDEWPLHAAALKNDSSAIIQLIQQKNIDPNQQCLHPQYGLNSTPILMAAEYGQLSAVIALIQYGADPFIHPDASGHTPYSIAVMKKQKAVVSFLEQYALMVHGVDIKDKMLQCHSCWKYDQKYCECCSKDQDEDNKGCKNMHIDKYVYCQECYTLNPERIKEQQTLNKSTQNRIRHILKTNPSISIDLLCDMRNKRGLEQLLRDITASSNPSQFHLYMMDLDDFKAINSYLGHHQADDILVEVGDILKSLEQRSRSYWKQKGVEVKRIWAFHQGGDEYSIVVEGSSNKPKDTRTQQILYEGLRDEVNGIKIKQKCIDKNEKQMERVGITTGVYCGSNGKPFGEWLIKADIAAEKVKQDDKDKNGLRVYDGWKEIIYADFTSFRKSK